MCEPGYYYYKHRCYPRSTVQVNCTCQGQEVCTVFGCTVFPFILGIVLAVFAVGLIAMTMGRYVVYRCAQNREQRRHEAEQRLAALQQQQQQQQRQAEAEMVVMRKQQDLTVL